MIKASDWCVTDRMDGSLAIDFIRDPASAQYRIDRGDWIACPGQSFRVAIGVPPGRQQPIDVMVRDDEFGPQSAKAIVVTNGPAVGPSGVEGVWNDGVDPSAIVAAEWPAPEGSPKGFTVVSGLSPGTQYMVEKLFPEGLVAAINAALPEQDRDVWMSAGRDSLAGYVPDDPLNPDWPTDDRHHDWKYYISDEVRAMWPAFTPEQRMALYRQAQAQDEAYWDRRWP